ncbi:protein rep [Cupriavidus taiwanensis]|uniref:protein rep n=1 Tax=Cupriavidus taiwanensis TaxID=164546 RepID=UPI000E16D47A|nr:protein rep [Cupriavidus taiwanensis]SOZ97318.1 Rep (modular protein) [Cupriavidus taiwanensis]
MRPRTLSPTGPAGAVLGINAKSSASGLNVTRIDPDTGEVVGAPRDPAATRWERFALQAAARKLLPDSRTAKCLRLRNKGQQIQVVKSREHKSATYKGLQTCSSVWACPVCAAKVSERRRVELLAAITQHQAQGGAVLLLTLTTPHYLGDDLGQVLAGQAKALSYFNGDRASCELFDEIKCIGKVRALEVTHGRKRAVNNGWHPHYHVLLFVASGLDLVGLRLRLHDRWFSACARAGVKPPSLEHGVRLDDGSKAAAYASKWGLESEMTKGHTKKALDGETPFDLLRGYLAETDKQAGALFVEFATVFKGKRQLFWSKGLKARFGIGEVSDEELAAQEDDKGVVLGLLTVEQWRAVLRHEARAIVLELAERGGWEAVEAYLESISRRDQAGTSGVPEPEQVSQALPGAGVVVPRGKPGLGGDLPDWLRSLGQSGFQDGGGQVSHRKVEVRRHVRQLAMSFGVDLQGLQVP